MKMAELNLNPVGPNERVSSAAIGANFDMIKAFLETLSAEQIKQFAIAIEGKENPSVEDALRTLNEKLSNFSETLLRNTNPILLINRRLRIWQRGLTITNPANTYIADRLKLDGKGTFNARLGADNKPIGGAILTGNIDCRYLMEHIDFEHLDGRELTFSYSKDGQVVSNTFIANVGNCPFDGDGRRIAAFSPGAGVLDWFNLDIGDRAMPFVPRSVAEELALCQRYYQLFAVRERNITFGPDILVFSVSAILPTRITPTIYFDGLSVFDSAAYPQAGFVLTSSGYHTNTAFGIMASKVAHGFKNEGFLYGNIAVDAEL